MSFLLFFFSSSMVNVVVLVLVVKGSGHLSDKYLQRSHYRFLTCDVTIKSYVDLYLGLSPSLFLIFSFCLCVWDILKERATVFVVIFFGIYLLTWQQRNALRLKLPSGFTRRANVDTNKLFLFNILETFTRVMIIFFAVILCFSRLKSAGKAR